MVLDWFLETGTVSILWCVVAVPGSFCSVWCMVFIHIESESVSPPVLFEWRSRMCWDAVKTKGLFWVSSAVGFKSHRLSTGNNDSLMVLDWEICSCVPWLRSSHYWHLTHFSTSDGLGRFSWSLCFSFCFVCSLGSRRGLCKVCVTMAVGWPGRVAHCVANNWGGTKVSHSTAVCVCVCVVAKQRWSDHFTANWP